MPTYTFSSGIKAGQGVKGHQVCLVSTDVSSTFFAPTGLR